MTAAPGPQQPDEDPDWVYDEVNGWLFGPDPDNPRLRYPFLFGADPEQCRTLAAYLNDIRPAAPSAQPDRSLSQHRRLAVQNPAQPDEREEGVRSFLTWLSAQRWRVRDDDGKPVGMPSKLLAMWRSERHLLTPAQPVRDTEETL